MACPLGIPAVLYRVAALPGQTIGFLLNFTYHKRLYFELEWTMNRIELLLTVGAFLLIGNARRAARHRDMSTIHKGRWLKHRRRCVTAISDALDTTAQRKAEIGSVITTVFLARNEASRKLTSGVISSVSLEELSSPAYLRDKVAELLTDRSCGALMSMKPAFKNVCYAATFASWRACPEA